jgi:hypothetical protein
LIENAGVPLLLFVLGGFILGPRRVGPVRPQPLPVPGRVRDRLPVARPDGGHPPGPRLRPR